MRNFSSRMKISGWNSLMNTLSRDEMREGIRSLVSAHNGNCIAPSSTLTVKVVKKAAQAAAKASKPMDTSMLRAEIKAHQAGKKDEKAKARDAFAKLFS